MQPDHPDAFVATITGADAPGVAGIGTLIDSDTILTCAHVVNKALGRAENSQDPPPRMATVTVRLPLLADPVTRSARVDLSRWFPVPPDGGPGFPDLAYLLIAPRQKRFPPRVPVARFADPSHFVKAEVDVFGCPPTRPPGWSTTRSQGIGMRGLLQLDVSPDAAIQAQPGFSGSPVVANRHTGRPLVIAVFVGASSRRTERDTYALPVGGGPAGIWPDTPLETPRDEAESRNAAERVSVMVVWTEPETRRDDNLEARENYWTIYVHNNSAFPIQDATVDVWAGGRHLEQLIAWDVVPAGRRVPYLLRPPDNIFDLDQDPPSSEIEFTVLGVRWRWRPDAGLVRI